MKLKQFVPLSAFVFAALTLSAFAEEAPAPAAPAAPAAASKPAAPAAAPAAAVDREARLQRMRERMQKRANELKAAPQQVRKAASYGTIAFEGHKVGPKDPAHKCEFTDWNYTLIDIPSGDITKGTVEAEINILSVKTDADKLTGHLKTADFFDAEKFPKATISIKNAVATTKDAEGQHYQAQGNLTIKGVSQPLNIDFVEVSKTPLRVKGTATVERNKFGVGTDKYSEANSTIADKVPVSFDVVVPEKVVKLADKADATIDKAAGKADEAATKANAAADGAAKQADKQAENAAKQADAAAKAAGAATEKATGAAAEKAPRRVRALPLP